MKHSTLEQKQASRFLAADLFAQDISKADIAHIVGCSRQTVSGWYQIWLEHGTEGLVLQKSGPKPKISKEQLEEITQDLLFGPTAHGYDTEFWTLERIAGMIKKKTGIAYSLCHVWRLLQQMNWSCQKPERLAKQRNEAAIAYWKEHDWPRIKRGRKTREPR